MHHRFLTLVLVLLASSSSAQEDLLACVDPDVREGLLFAGTPATMTTTTLVSRTVPDELTGLPESGDLEFIGSRVSQFQIVAAYKSALAPSDAMNIASGFLREAGWLDFDMGTPPRGGFTTGDRPQFEMLCRESALANVASRASNDTTYVRVQVVPDRGGFPCGEISGVQRGLIARTPLGANLFDHMPTLVLPGGATTSDPRFALAPSPTGFSGNNRRMSSEIDLETDLSAQDLVEHFGQQLEEQGWRYDSGWSGQYSSGSGWTLLPTTELELVGLLDVIALGSSGYRTTFRASSRESE